MTHNTTESDSHKKNSQDANNHQGIGHKISHFLHKVEDDIEAIAFGTNEEEEASKPDHFYVNEASKKKHAEASASASSSAKNSELKGNEAVSARDTAPKQLPAENSNPISSLK